MSDAGKRLIAAAQEARDSYQCEIVTRDVRIEELEFALRLALVTAESWIHDQLDGTSHLKGALAELQPCRDALEQKANKG